MTSRAAAILMAILALILGAHTAEAQGRGGMFGLRGGGFHGRGFPAEGFRGGGFRGGGFRDRGRGYPMAPPPYRGGYGGGYRGPDGYGPPPAWRSPPPPAGFSAPPRAFGAPLDTGWRQQQNEVRNAVREGRHIPLNQAIDAVRRRAPGRELDAGLEPGPSGRPVYRLRWAGQDGRRRDYLVDAGSGAVIGVQGGP